MFISSKKCPNIEEEMTEYRGGNFRISRRKFPNIEREFLILRQNFPMTSNLLILPKVSKFWRKKGWGSWIIGSPFSDSGATTSRAPCLFSAPMSVQFGNFPQCLSSLANVQLTRNLLLLHQLCVLSSVRESGQI